MTAHAPESKKVYEGVKPPAKRYYFEMMAPGSRHYIFSRNMHEGGPEVGIDALDMVRHWMVTPDD